MKVLLTGGSGTLGTALLTLLDEARGWAVTCLGRTPPKVAGRARFVAGDFTRPEGLEPLGDEAFDALIHLAAVTGGCSERDGLLVNVEGTRNLLSWALARGCRRVVCASSIAACGIQWPDPRPEAFPLRDDHPCHDTHGYGFSKALMEEVTRYLHRQMPEVMITNLRFGSCSGLGATYRPCEPAWPPPPWTFGHVTPILAEDVVACLIAAAERPLEPGVHIHNATSPRLNATCDTATLLATWWPQRQWDLSWYERAGHERDGLFDLTSLRERLGVQTRAPS